MPVELIRSARDITESWLTEILRTSGVLSESEDVIGLRCESFGDAAGLLGMLYRVHPRYSPGAQGPASLVVKLPTDDPGQRGVADTLGFYRREVTFYQRFADDLPFRVPRPYAALQDDATTDFVIVMEDIGHLAQLDQVQGASLGQTESVIRQIARFHANWSEHPDLGELSDVFVPLDAPQQVAALPTIFESGWAGCKQHGSALLTPEIEAFGDQWGEFVPYMLGQLATQPTLVHGDFRADNTMFDENNGLVLIDFQIIGIANGLYDIAYFMCQSIDRDVRRGHDRELVQLYVDTLRDGGVDTDIERAWRIYQAGVAFCLIKAVTVFRGWDSFGGRQHELITKMLSRTIEAIHDADALASLP